MLNIGGMGSGGSELGLIGLPNMSRSPMTMVKSPIPGACAAAFTVGFPKPRSASHVAASMRSLLETFSSRNTLRTKSVSSLLLDGVNEEVDDCKQKDQ